MEFDTLVRHRLSVVAITGYNSAWASGLPALVNIACDPAVAYPRSTNLA
jgi:hypothetical protein